jgi:hypothetical protein
MLAARPKERDENENNNKKKNRAGSDVLLLHTTTGIATGGGGRVGTRRPCVNAPVCSRMSSRKKGVTGNVRPVRERSPPTSQGRSVGTHKNNT